MGLIKRNISSNTGSAVGGAENGLSVVNPAPGDFRAVLGNNVGGTDATLLSDREIPTDGNFLAITGTGNILLNSITDYLQKLQVSGPVLQYNDLAPAPVTDYIVIDILGTDGLSERVGMTMVTSGGNVGIGFVNNIFAVGVNPAIVLTQSGFGDDVFILDTPSVAAGEMGLFAQSGNGFIGSTATILDNGRTFQVQGSASIDAELGVGNVGGVGAWITVGAGDNTKAPFNYSVGGLTAALTNGNKEFDGDNEFLTAGAIRYTLAKTLQEPANLDFPLTAAHSSSDLIIAVPNAAVGSVCMVGVPIGSVLPDSCYTAFVSAPGVVTVRFNNYSANPQDPPIGSFRVSAIEYS